MRVAYEKIKESARIFRVYSYGDQAELPESIEGLPVTELAPYAFSAHQDEEMLKKRLDEGSLLLTEGEDAPPLMGERLKGIKLPASLEKIGAYAFYNCNALEELSFSGVLHDLGAGLFTGCHHLGKLNLTLEGETSCLSEILMEVPEKQRVRVEGSYCADLTFPEFFEEGVENTPARILVTQVHGSGLSYRNCFYQHKLDFKLYDSCFYRARAAEDVETVLEIAIGRLRYPHALSGEAGEAYRTFLSAHLREAAVDALKRRDQELLVFLTEELLVKHLEARALLKELSAQAGELGNAEGSAYLLDVLHRSFRPAAKKFAFE